MSNPVAAPKDQTNINVDKTTIQVFLRMDFAKHLEFNLQSQGRQRQFLKVQQFASKGNKTLGWHSIVLIGS